MISKFWTMLQGVHEGRCSSRIGIFLPLYLLFNVIWFGSIRSHLVWSCLFGLICFGHLVWFCLVAFALVYFDLFGFVIFDIVMFAVLVWLIRFLGFDLVWWCAVWFGSFILFGLATFFLFHLVWVDCIWFQLGLCDYIRNTWRFLWLSGWIVG